MKPLDDAKFSGTKDVDERLKIDSANLQPWIDAVSYTHLTLPTITGV